MSLFIQECAMISPVGFNAESSAAAIRAKLRNIDETIYYAIDGSPIFAGQVPLPQPEHADQKLFTFIDSVLAECLEKIPQKSQEVVLVLCLPISEDLELIVRDRDAFLQGLEDRYGPHFGGLHIIEGGEVGPLRASKNAHKFLADYGLPIIVIVGVDSFLSPARLDKYERQDRIATEKNMGGFIPGEGASAIVLSQQPNSSTSLAINCITEAYETSHYDSGLPSQADGLAACLKTIVSQDPDIFHKVKDLFLTVSGEHFYFKEVSLSLSRTVRNKPDNFEYHHSVESTGRAGAASLTNDLAYCLSRARRIGMPPESYLFLVTEDDGGRGVAQVDWLGGENAE